MTDDTREQIGEEWRVVPQYPIYEVSSLGRVRSRQRQFYCINRGVMALRKRSAKILRTRIDKEGYERIVIRDFNCRCVYIGIHRLVAFAFIPNPEMKPYINHKDSDRKNNCINNLEWCTPAENLQHCILNGRRDHVKITPQCLSKALEVRAKKKLEQLKKT